MSTFETIILGIVQSLTEFFPISSSAHLIILPNILGWEKQSLTFDLVLHFGTAMSLIVFFRNDLWNMIKNVILDFIVGPFKEKKITLSPDSRYSLYLLVGCLPAGLLGVFFGDYIEESVRDLKLVIVFLIIYGFTYYICSFLINILLCILNIFVYICNTVPIYYIIGRLYH